MRATEYGAPQRVAAKPRAKVVCNVAREQVVGVSSAKAEIAHSRIIDTPATNSNDFFMSFDSPVREGDRQYCRRRD